jgi:hypothetical protein
MRTSVTSSRCILAGVIFFTFEVFYVASLVLLLTHSNYLQLVSWKFSVQGLFWISFVGLLVMTFLLRKRSFPFASIGWPTLLVGFLLGLFTPTL